MKFGAGGFLLADIFPLSVPPDAAYRSALSVHMTRALIGDLAFFLPTIPQPAFNLLRSQYVAVTSL